MNEELQALVASLDPNLLVFNGVLPSGDYAIKPATPDEVFTWAIGAESPDYADELEARLAQNEEETTREAYIDPSPLLAGGWAAIFPGGDDRLIAALKDALKPLLEHRKAQTRGVNYRDDLVYNVGNDSREAFFRRIGIAPAEPLNPTKLPYYLLVVGSPVEIPYNTFQYPLDAGYAVGRIYFSDGKDGHDIEAYADYAQRVIEAETKPKRPRRLAFFAPWRESDRATVASAGRLIQPLRQRLEAIDSISDWDMLEPFYGGAATKDRLRTLMGGAETPAILFTASHGMEFESGDRRQMAEQGALVCVDWEGPGSHINPDMYFAGSDIERDLDGLIGFHFACFSAGTPPLDDFTENARERRQIAPQAFMAALPTNMLKRGALAAIGHVERAWGTSFQWSGIADAQVGAFENTLQLIMEGYPVGHAMQEMNLRYTRLSAALQALRYDLDGEFSNPQLEADLKNQYSYTWTANNDARSYVIVGDPAVKAAVDYGGTSLTAERTIIQDRITVTSPTPVQPSTLPEMPSTSAAPRLDVVGNQIVIQIGDQQAVIAAQVQSVAADGSVESFGLFDNVRDIRDKLTEAVENFANQMGDTLNQIVRDATDLTVETYVVPSESSDQPDTPRARTVMRLDGDTELYVPEKSGELDTRLWNIHLGMVEQAQSYRVEMIRALISASAELIKALKG